MSVNSINNQRPNPYAILPRLVEKTNNPNAQTTSVALKSDASSVTISPEAMQLFEQSQQAQTNTVVDDLSNDAKYNVPTMQAGVFYNVDKWIDTHMSAQDKQVLGFPFEASTNTDEKNGLRELSMAIMDKRHLGFLQGPLSKQYLTDEGPYGIGNVKKWPQFQSASAQNMLNDLFNRMR